MSSSITTLHEKIQKFQQRRKQIFWVRQGCFAGAGVVVWFFLLALVEMYARFTVVGHSVLWVLFIGGSFFWSGLQLRVLWKLDQDQQRLAHYMEEHLPDLEQRLLTSIEFEKKEPSGASAHLVEKLWEDAQAHLETQNVQAVTPRQKIWPAASGAILGVVILLGAWGSSLDFSRASGHILWPWGADAVASLPPTLTVAPGDLRMQRGKNLTLLATVENTTPEAVKLYLQTDRVHWDEVPMLQEGESSSYAYYLAAVEEDFTYYVDMGEKRSRQYQITVFEMPRIERLQVLYEYPPHTGMEPFLEENVGDIVAPEGTEITLHVSSNKPLNQASLTFEDGTLLEMTPAENHATVRFKVTKNNRYTLKILDNEQLENENPPEYFVQAIADTAPELDLVLPGKDRKVTALEEVSIVATAKDDYGLEQFVLHYNLPGHAEQTIPLLTAPKQEQNLVEEGRALIYLEDLQVQPGQFITYYLSAKDNNALPAPSEVFSDIYFLEVISTKEEFLRASGGQMGGGGGGGGMGGGRNQQPSALAENQKKIIAATWKLLHQEKDTEKQSLAEDIKIVARSQREVLQRAEMSFRRLAERFSFSDETYDKAVNYMKEALAHMEAAAEQLEQAALKNALVPEQAALQSILQADALSKQTRLQTARNQGQAGQGERAQQEREDLRELFEMEMGRLESRYELPQRRAASTPQAQAEEDFLSQLKELARRQERTNRAQNDLARRQNQMSEEEVKRQLEQLRREQEELSQQAQNLAEQASRLNSASRGRSGGQARQQQLNQASEQMQEAARSLLRQNLQTAETQSRQALEKLRKQENSMNQNRSNPTANLVDALNQKALELNEQEKQIQQSLAHLPNFPQGAFAPSESVQNQEQGAQNDETGQNPAAEQEALPQEIQELVEQKEKLQRNLKETEKVLRAVIARGEEEEPQITMRAMDALRSLKSRRIEEQIVETQYLLQEGQVDASKEREKEIAQHIDQFSTRLQNIGSHSAHSRDEQLQQAASTAQNLQQELANLQRQVEALKQQNQQQQQTLSQLQRGSNPTQPGQNQPAQNGAQNQPGQSGQPAQNGLQNQPGQSGQLAQNGLQNLAQQSQSGQRGNSRMGLGSGGSLSRMRDDLRRIQRYARGLIEPWALGERWAVDARSVHRELRQKEIEDFLAQPDLWKRLEKPLEEIQAKLRAQTELNQVKKKLFTTPQEDIPPTYQDLVENYYRALSQENQGRVLRQ